MSEQDMGASASQTFTNELGNHIKIEVRRLANGTVWTYMEGPSSATELEMTAMEAAVLHRSLGDLITNQENANVY